MATPIKLFALPASVASEKLLPNNALTIAPAGFVVSSSIAVKVALPLATGASFTAVTLTVIVFALASRFTPPLFVPPLSST